MISIDNLRTQNKKGKMGLFALFDNRFSNFRFTGKEVVAQDKKESMDTMPSNIISQWNITEALPFDESNLSFMKFSKEKVNSVNTEESGLLPFSKYIEKPSAGGFEKNTEVYSVASKRVELDVDQGKLFSFDYSDKIIVYLNGKAIFKGNNAFRSKGIQYQGHLDINANKLYLNLKKGKNVIHCVVINKANG